MQLSDTSTSDKAFKASVRPLGGLLILQSVGLLYVFSTWPADTLNRVPLPFVPDYFKQYFLITCALLILIIGIGLFLRLRPLWYLFVSYLIVGPIWLILGVAFDFFPDIGASKGILIPLMALVSVLVGGGLYIVTKPAFIRKS